MGLPTNPSRIPITALTGALGLLLLSRTLAQTAEGWPNWRGPSAQGSSKAQNVPTKWTPTDVVWKLPLPGKGTSTPIFSKNRLFVTTPAEGEDAVLAIDPSGKVLWQTKLGPQTNPKHRSSASSCNASPVTDGQGVFVYFKSGHFAALELDGSVRWQHNLTERFGQERLFWDQGSSPMVTDQHVILARLHQGESWLAAFDKITGELRWQQPRNYQVPTENDNGYTTPLLFEQDGNKALLVWGADHLTAHSATDGKLLWSAGGFNPEATGYWPAIATPVIAGGMVVVPVGRDDRPNQARIHGIRLGGQGDVSETHRAWKREDLGVFVAALAAHEGRVYLLRHRGEVVCLDPATGKTLWSDAFPRTSAPYYSSPVVASGVLYAAREDGVVFSARVGEHFEFLSENALGERIIATPVPVTGRLFLRGDQHLYCIASK